MEISELIKTGAQLKAEIDSKKIQLAEINRQLAKIAQYKEGSQTGHIYTEHYHVKVALKKNVKWDQKKLSEARSLIGDEKFFKVFGWKFEPKNKGVLDGFIENADEQYTSSVLAAMTVSEGSPTVTYEEIGA